jgi:hypothetical protein
MGVSHSTSTPTPTSTKLQVPLLPPEHIKEEIRYATVPEIEDLCGQYIIYSIFTRGGLPEEAYTSTHPDAPLACIAFRDPIDDVLRPLSVVVDLYQELKQTKEDDFDRRLYVPVKQTGSFGPYYRRYKISTSATVYAYIQVKQQNDKWGMVWVRPHSKEDIMICGIKMT